MTICGVGLNEIINKFNEVLRVGPYSNGAGVLIERGDTRDTCAERQPREDTGSTQHPPAKEKGLRRNQPCWLRDLGLPASRTVRNKCLWPSAMAV